MTQPQQQEEQQQQQKNMNIGSSGINEKNESLAAAPENEGGGETVLELLSKHRQQPASSSTSQTSSARSLLDDARQMDDGKPESNDSSGLEAAKRLEKSYKGLIDGNEMEKQNNYFIRAQRVWFFKKKTNLLKLRIKTIFPPEDRSI